MPVEDALNERQFLPRRTAAGGSICQCSRVRVDPWQAANLALRLSGTCPSIPTRELQRGRRSAVEGSGQHCQWPMNWGGMLAEYDYAMRAGPGR